MNQRQKLRILVLCTGNSCRSQIAEGYFRHYGGDWVEVFSAGLEPKGVNPRAIQVMNEVGIDISKHTSDHLSKYIGQSFDYVITVCDNAAANCPVFPGAGTKLHWPFEDPADATGMEEQVLAVFRRIRDEIGTKIKNWLMTSGVLTQ
jgi:arsenate reductase